MKSKNDWLAEAWIPITKRLPPLDDSWILVWHYEWEQPMVWRAREMYQAIINLRESKLDLVSHDRKVSHWMKIIRPK